MKFYSVAIISALVFAAVASGAPSSPNTFLGRISVSDIPIFGKVKELFGKVKCMGDVVSDVLEKSNVKGMLKDSKVALETVIKVDWKKCMEMEDADAQQECKAKAVDKAFKILYDIYQTLFGENKIDLIKQMRTEIAEKCFKRAELEQEDDDELVYISEMKVNPSFVEQFQCLVDVLGQVSKAHGLEELWGKTGPVLEHHIKKWGECANVENKYARIFCNIKEGVETYKIFNDYLKQVAAEKPEVIQALIPEFKKQCGAFQAQDEEQFWMDVEPTENVEYKGIEHLKCISKAITDAVHETDFAPAWEAYKKDLEDAFERMKACKQESSPLETAKCVGKEVYGSYQILGKFLKSLKKENREMYKRIREYIKKRCYA